MEPFPGYDLLRLLGIPVALGVGAVAWRNRSEAGATSLAVIMAGVVVWLGSDAGQELVANRYLFEAVFYVRLLGTALVVLGWFTFAVEYAGLDDWLTRRTVALLAVEPAVLALALATNPYHQLIYATVHTELTNSGVWLEAQTGFWLHVAYSHVLVLTGAALLVRLLFRSHSLYPQQVYAVLLSMFVPWIVEALFDLGIIEAELTPIALSGTGVILAIALFRFDLLQIAPAAKSPLLENISDGVLVVDRRGRITDSNDTVEDLLGLDAEDITGRTDEEVLAPFPTISALGHADEERTEECTVDVDGERRTLKVQVTPLWDHRDELAGQVFTLHDISEQKRRQRELERQNDQLDQFASVVSHDLRNPLNVAKGRAELTVETGDTAHVANAMKSLDRMERLIEDVLALAREGQTIEETRPVSLPTVAEQAWEQVETTTAELVVETDSTIEADHHRLQRLFENLFRNSVDHAGRDVTVTVGSTDAGFSVADDGTGIPESQRDSVLQHGYSTADDGTGLGLSIVGSIADAHGWDVAVSESESGGARFEIRGVNVLNGADDAPHGGRVSAESQ